MKLSRQGYTLVVVNISQLKLIPLITRKSVSTVKPTYRNCLETIHVAFDKYVWQFELACLSADNLKAEFETLQPVPSA